MQAYPYSTVPAEPAEGLPGVAIRWAIGKNVGAPNFVTRIIEVQPGCFTVYHQHPWEHEAVILEGAARLRDAQSERQAGPGGVCLCGAGRMAPIRQRGRGPVALYVRHPLPARPMKAGALPGRRGCAKLCSMNA
jgi:hypothetical protein